MRFTIGICALVFLLSLTGAFFAGYRVGALEAENTALHQPQEANVATVPAATAPDPSNEQTTIHKYFAEETRPQEISGAITLGQDLAKQLKTPFTFGKNDVLFVVATKSELGPQPLAVVRINNLEGKTLPIKYEIGPEDLMIQDQGVFAGPLNIKVKLSHSGDAKTNLGDLLGYPTKAASISPGMSDVDLELREIASADAHREDAKR